MLTGILRPTSGSIRVKNLSIAEHSLEIKKLLGYLPESAPLYHDMLVYDYLDYVADVRSITGDRKPARVKALSDLCALAEVMHKPIGELSKGYRQRVGLAHAMMSDPEILILDEPTSGLDPNQIVEIREIIRRIGREKTIILSTHILSEAEAACDRVVIIHQGKIAADGSMEQLKHVSGHSPAMRLKESSTSVKPPLRIGIRSSKSKKTRPYITLGIISGAGSRDPAEGFRDKTVLSFDPAGVVELTLEREGRGITLIPEPAGSDSGSVWKASDERAVDASGVNDLLATLSSLKCRSYIPDRKGDDFRDPIYTVRLKGGISASLSIFPKEKPEDDGHPAVSSENEYPFILSSDQAERIMKTPEEPVKSE